MKQTTLLKSLLLSAAMLGGVNVASGQITTDDHGRKQYVWNFGVEAKPDNGTYYLQTTESGCTYKADNTGYQSDYTISMIEVKGNSRQIFSSTNPDSDKGAGVSLGSNEGYINIFAPIVGKITLTGNYAGRVTIADKSDNDKKLYTGASNASQNAGQSIVSNENTVVGHRYQFYASGGMGVASITIAEPGYGETLTAPAVAFSNGTLTLTAAGTSSLNATVKTYYTTDGSEPTKESNELTSSATIEGNITTVKVISISEYDTKSAVTTLYVGLIAANEHTLWNFADYTFTKSTTEGQFLADGTLYVGANVTYDGTNKRAYFDGNLTTTPTELGEKMIAFKTGVAGQVIMRLKAYSATVAVSNGSASAYATFVGGTNNGNSVANASYHGGGTYYILATFKAEANTTYYIYGTAGTGSNVPGVFNIEYIPNGNTTTPVTEETSWDFTTETNLKYRLPNFYGITFNNFYFGNGLEWVCETSNNKTTARLRFSGTGNTSTGDNTFSFKVAANTGGTLVVTPSSYYGNVLLTDGTTTLKTFGQSEHGKVNTVTIEPAETERTLYFYTTSTIQNTSNVGLSKMSWTPITAVTLDNTNAFTTYSSPFALDFSSLTEQGVYAYVATAAETGKVTLKAVTEVPKETGIIVKNPTAAALNIPVKASATLSETNLLKAQLTAGSVAASAGGTYHYVLGKNKTSGEFAFYNLASAVDLGANKAYLETSVNLGTDGTARLSIFGEDETTAVEAIATETTTTAVYYNLQGQRVNQPTRGMYIMYPAGSVQGKNGKKVIIK